MLCGYCPLRAPRHRRQAVVRVGYYVDDGGAARGEGLLQRALDVAGALHADAEAPDGLRHRREVGVGEPPQVFGVAAFHSGVGALVAALVLAEGAIVVDNRYHVDIVAYRRFQLGDVIPEPAVAAEAQHRAVGQGALGPHRRRQSPAQRPGAADVA